MYACHVGLVQSHVASQWLRRSRRLKQPGTLPPTSLHFETSTMPSRRLPDPLILAIILESDVSTLKRLRLVSRGFYALIETYGKSINAKLSHSLYSNDLIECFTLAWHEECAVEALFDIDRRIRIARWMAALALKHTRHLVGPLQDWMQDPLCDAFLVFNELDMWNHITMGLGIMWRLAELGREQRHDSTVHNGLQASTAPVELLEQDLRSMAWLDNTISQAQITHIRNLAEMRRICLCFALEFCVRELFAQRYLFDEYDEYGKLNIPKPQVTAKYTWAKWFVLRSGPDFIARAWKSADDKAVCGRLLVDELQRRSLDQIEIEISTAEQLYEAANEVLPSHWCDPEPDLLHLIATEDELRTGWVKAEYAEVTKGGRLALGKHKNFLRKFVECLGPPDFGQRVSWGRTLGVRER